MEYREEILDIFGSLIEAGIQLAPPVYPEDANLTPDERLVAEIRELGMGTYFDVRMLEDGTIIGIGRLLFTTAIYMDMDRCGFGARYCFEDQALALTEYAKLKSGDDQPTGWVATRQPRRFA